MGSFKKTIQKTKSFINIKTYKRPLLYIITMMILLNIFILVMASMIALAIDDSFENFFDAFFNGSLKWMLTPNAILLITNQRLLALAVVVLITGLVLFSGTIIALATNAIKEYFQAKKENSGKIDLDEHIVIINWNSKVPELVSDLLYLDMKLLTIMIVSTCDKNTAEQMILNALKNEKKSKKIANLNVLVKQSDPLIASHLSDISIEKAKAVIIMNDESHNDLHIIKNVLSLGPISFSYHPPIVVEIKEHETENKLLTLSKVIKDLGEHQILPVCFDQRLGQIIAQTLIEERLESLYLSLFSFEGSEIYHIKHAIFDNVLYKYSHAVPVMAQRDDVFALSLSHETIKHIENVKKVNIKSLKMNSMSQTKDMNIYIIGRNHKLNYIEKSLRHYEEQSQSHFTLSTYEHSKLHEVIDILNQSHQPAQILLLSDDTKAFHDLDSDIIESLIVLETHLKNDEVSIIVEILNPKHSQIIQSFRIKHTIISNKIISLLLSKLALQPETSHFYHELLTIDHEKNGVDLQSISIIPAKTYLNETFPITFDSTKSCIASLYESSNQSFISIGYYRKDTLYFFEGNLFNQPHDILETDELIFIRVK